MVKVVDVPPRQILVEARIVEVDRNKALDAGIDVSRISTFANSNQDLTNEVSKRRSSTVGGPELEGRDQFKVDRRRLSTSVGLSQFLTLLDESGAATFRDAPRILTINNRRATILDGQRVTYITRYSSYTNLFETDTLDAGLTLSVLPSLGESGYLTLDIRAELTTLRSEISGSPVKDGQIVENTVMVKDGESILLGGFQRTTEERVHRRFPLLGHVLPFLFSREIVKKTTRESFVVLTPRVVDLATGLDSRTREVIQGR
jgi:type IV pilus assembly protein PilQ